MQFGKGSRKWVAITLVGVVLAVFAGSTLVSGRRGASAWGAQDTVFSPVILAQWVIDPTATASIEPTIPVSATVTRTGTPGPSPTSTPTATPTQTPTVTSTASTTPTPTATQSDSGAYDYYLTGDGADAVVPTTPGLLLMGGDTDVDAAMLWMIEHAEGGDFVVIRASGGNGYNNYLYNMGNLDSVETIVFQEASAAYDPFVLQTIENAEALFIAGGDQWKYVDYWRGTPVEDAIHALRDQGVPIGGTSAGLAVLGEFYFSAQNGTVYSHEALADPYNMYMTLGNDFLEFPHLSGVITDSHFQERDRMGRLVGFLARIVQDGWAGQARGIAVDEVTALVVEADGTATRLGSGNVYFLETPGAPEVCQPGQPLTFLNVSVYRLSDGGSFDLATWTGQGGTAYTVSAEDEVLTSSQDRGGVY